MTATATAPVTAKGTFPLPAAVAACVTFAIIGAAQALYGPAIPALRGEYGIGPAAAGTALSAHFAGALVGVLIAARLRRRLPDGRILAGSLVLTAAGGAGFAFAGSWPIAIAAVLLLGVGFGGLDYGLNVMVAEGFGRKSTAMLNIINACFGIGAIAGPALLAGLGADGYPLVFLGCAAACLLMVPPLLLVRDAPPPPPGPAGNLRAAAWTMAAFIAIYVLHVGIETGVGGWEPTHLEALDFSPADAATATAGFWLAMTLGRFLIAPFCLRLRPQTVVISCCALMTGCLVLAAVPALAPYAYLGVGLAIAPIFPTGLSWLAERVPGSAGAQASVIAACMIGGIAFPPMLGAAFQLTGSAQAMPLVLAGLSAVCAAFAFALRR